MENTNIERDNLLLLLNSDNEESALLGVVLFKNGGYNYFLGSAYELRYNVQSRLLYDYRIIASNVFCSQLDVLLHLPFAKLLTLSIRIFVKNKRVEYSDTLLYIDRVFKGTNINEIYLDCGDSFIEWCNGNKVANKLYKCVWKQNGYMTFKRLNSK